MANLNFPDVTLLITHYNRSRSLKRLLIAFKDLNLTFGEIIVSDDGSNAEQLDVLKFLQDEFPFVLITTPSNRGLGNNINKGQNRVKTSYTLYVQEDFIPTKKFTEVFPDALEILKAEARFDILRFFAYKPYPYLKTYRKGFSEMIINPWSFKTDKIYGYSDHPHLRRSCFLEKFGQYAEGIKGDRTEYKMCISFIKKKGRGLFYDDYKSLFIQKNTEEEPSTMIRSSWRQSKSPVVKMVRNVYRQIRYNFDIHF